MQYRKFGNTGIEVSPLGFGMMRLPLITGERGASDCDPTLVDTETSIDMVRRAVDEGLNYIDTAYPYLGGMSEIIAGRALEGGRRDKVFIATKAPVWMFRSEEDFDKILSIQFERLKTDHIDFYLLHSLNKGSWQKKVLRHNIVEKLFAAKRDGRVGHVGFSFHDNVGLFKEITDYAPWDSCLIQLNYLDVNFQAGIEGLKYAAAKGLAVSIMEPLRGGYLAELPSDVNEILKSMNPHKSPVEWALNFLWDMPEVSNVLSGITTPEQLHSNLEYSKRASAGMLTQAERTAISAAREQFGKYNVAPCTGCAYCMPCPEGIAIPNNFFIYNEYQTHGNLEMARDVYLNRIPLYGERALECIGCRSCEDNCPQHIEISAWMPKINKLLG